MPFSVLLPEVIKQQARLERQLARQRRGEVGCEDKDFVMDWFAQTKGTDPADYEVWSYVELLHHLQEDIYPQVPQRVWDYFNLDEYILDLTQDEAYTLIYYDNSADEQRIFEFANLRTEFPQWTSSPYAWFYDHPCKDRFYIVRKDA